MRHFTPSSVSATNCITQYRRMTAWPIVLRPARVKLIGQAVILLILFLVKKVRAEHKSKAIRPNFTFWSVILCTRKTFHTKHECTLQLLHGISPGSCLQFALTSAYTYRHDKLLLVHDGDMQHQMSAQSMVNELQSAFLCVHAYQPLICTFFSIFHTIASIE